MYHDDCNPQPRFPADMLKAYDLAPVGMDMPSNHSEQTLKATQKSYLLLASCKTHLKSVGRSFQSAIQLAFLGSSSRRRFTCINVGLIVKVSLY